MAITERFFGIAFMLLSISLEIVLVYALLPVAIGMLSGYLPMAIALGICLVLLIPTGMGMFLCGLSMLIKGEYGKGNE